jgi:CRISPR-associated endoribonuclease Cas6
MLLSVVFRMTPLRPGSLPAQQGRALMKIFLDFAGKENAGLFDALHNGSGVRPYTVSTLREEAAQNADRLVLVPGQALWWRVTSLDDQLSEWLLGLLDQGLPEDFTIADQGFRLLDASIDPRRHEWAGAVDYHQLDAKWASFPETLTFEFASPTTFHGGGKYLPFPLPKNVVEQWQKKWNAFSGREPIPDQIVEYADASLAVSAHAIASQEVHFGKEQFIGFTGWCKYAILEKHPYWTGKLYNLARFAFYCGTGAKTSFGLGQTRLIK